MFVVLMRSKIRYKQYTFKICVISIFQESTRSKVDDLDFSSACVHEHVLILDVPVYNPPRLTELQGLNNLPQKPTTQGTTYQMWSDDKPMLLARSISQ